ncbi:WD40-repeat-containing domain protein [Chytriomyces sp. MP71]|nr:WD40-repeat-containing domain protein [Chytriomyces sp. MP71]
MLNLAPAAPKDFEVTPGPTDGISDLSFSGGADLLAASSFDCQTRIWEVQANGSTVPKAAITHDAPALCCVWSKDGTKLFSGGADKAGKMMDIQTGQTTQVAGHDAPISCARFAEGIAGAGPMVVTGSWDKTLKYWDLRTPNPAFTLQMPERVYSLDIAFPLMVVATAERNIMIYNLNSPSQLFKTVQSPLKFQTRVVSCFPNATGYAIGSIEGRVGIQYVEDKDSSSNFSFKCHRDEKNNVHSVNAISFHPTYGTFSTAGGDGTYSFWDKDSKQRLKLFPSVGNTISATAFNRNGTIFAYASSYDWGKGHENYKQGSPNQIFLYAVKDEDVKPKPKPKTR